MILILLEIDILDTFMTVLIWTLGIISSLFIFGLAIVVCDYISKYIKSRNPQNVASIIKEKIMNCETIDWVTATHSYKKEKVHTLLYELDDEELVEAVVGYTSYNFNKWIRNLDDKQKSKFAKKNDISISDFEQYITNIGNKVTEEIKRRKNAKGILEAYRDEHPQKKTNDTPENANQEITEVEQTPHDYQIAEGRLTDFTKIVRAMYQCEIIQPARKETGLNKDNCIKAIGAFLGTEFKTEPKQLINAAKNNSNYFDVFKDLKDNAL